MSEVIIRDTVVLATPQLAAVIGLSLVETPGDVTLEQTQSTTGGQHLYVKMGGREWHVARSGRVTELNVAAVPSV